MKKYLKSIIPVLIMLFFINGSNITFSQMSHSASVPTVSASSDFTLAMRKLWEDHIVWTRNVILNIIDGLPGTDEAVARLLKNQDDIGDAIKPYYGNDAGDKLTKLLREHITIAADLLKAAKSGDQTAFKDANKKWIDNADEIANFLSSANPNLPGEDMKKMMQDHLSLTTDEALARLNKDYNADVAAYDKVHDEIIMMSDGLANAIIKQFPDKFK